MKKSNRFSLLALLSFVLLSCSKDWIESDLKGKTVSIITPADNDTLNTTTPLIWWHEIDAALKYRLQIAYPSFSNVQQLVYDTAVSGDRFYPALQAGRTYQWRIRPENGSSEGDWILRTITIDSSISLANQQIIFSSPVNGYATNQSSLNISWNALSDVSFYRVTVTNTGSNTTEADFTTTSNSYNASLAEGTYRIRVRGENSNSFTANDSLAFAFDFTAPSAPSLAQPADNSTQSTGAINFIWAHASDAVRDTFYLATDSLFSNQVFPAFSTQNPNYSWSGAVSGNTYWWKVRSVDAAGNTGTYIRRKFTVN